MDGFLLDCCFNSDYEGLKLGNQLRTVQIDSAL
jgi:hypothetical protein